jgi:arginase
LESKRCGFQIPRSRRELQETRVDIGIVGVALDLGADRRGVDMGASAIRYAGLEVALRGDGHNVQDFADIPAPVRESTDSGPRNLKYLHPISQVCEELAARVGTVMDAGFLPLVLGGDHSVSLGSVAAIARRKRIGVIWLDAHGDFNTAHTSPSGNIHGMVLSALTGYGDERLVHLGGRGPKVDPRHVALVGVRDLDTEERTLLHESGARVFTMHDIDCRGLPDVIADVLGGLDDDLDGIHLSLDLDVVDPTQAPGVGTPVRGGLTYREAHLAMELLADSGRLCSIDVVEVNPVLDAQNETARLAVAFTASALGKRIY